MNMSAVFSSDHSYDRPFVLLDTQVTTSACAVMVRVELRSTVRVEPPRRDRRGGSPVSAETNTWTRVENLSAVLGTHHRRVRSRSRQSKNMSMDVLSPLRNHESRSSFLSGPCFVLTVLMWISMFETRFGSPPEEGEAEEPLEVFVGILKAAAFLAAAEKSHVHSAEAAPPRAGDAVYPAEASPAEGAPGTSRTSESKSGTCYQQKWHQKERREQELHEQEGHEQEQHEQGLRQHEAQRYTKKQHHVARVVCCLHVCVRARKSSNDQRRMPTHIEDL